MRDDSDRDLLRAFADYGDEEAFGEIVRRWGGLVYGVAVRRTGDRTMAEEVAQNVLTTLARRAGELAAHPALAGWLHKAAHFEARRAVEKESNRRRHMHRYAQEQAGSLAESTGERGWREALPELDAAVAALPERDRAIVLLRFMQAQPYRVIAESAGLTVAACEKRIERAMARMSRFLRGRGVVLSAGALAAGLTSALTEAAVPPAVLAQLAAGATGAAKSAPALTGMGELFMLMKTKQATIVLPLLLTLLSGALGFAAARSFNADPVSQESGSAPLQSARPDAAPKPPPLATALGPRRESLRALLEAAQRDLATATHDPAAAARAAARIAAIAPEDVRAALALADELVAAAGDSSTLAALVFQRWAEFDPEAACDAALARGSGGFLGMPALADPLKVWAARDPRAAFDWYRRAASVDEIKARETKERDGQRWQPISSLRWIMGAWALRDAPAAVAAFKSLTQRDEIDGAITGFAELSGTASGRLLVLEAWREMNRDQRHAWSDLNSLLRRWSDHQPAELAGWLDRTDVDKSYHGSLAKPILAGWLREDSVTAIDWWFQAPGGYPDRSHRMDTLMEAWSEVDLFAAAEWLAGQPLDESASRSMATLSAQIARSDPERAWQWALRVPNSPYRPDALRQVAVTWARSDKEAAADAVQSAALDEATRAKLVEALAQP
ncbi:MAG: RNA polymerase sigma factor [Verrucomicrobiales bacterium]